MHRAAPYVSWLKAAGCVAQRPARITGPVRISIAAGRPDRRRRDVDNLSKAALDLLVSHQVIEDDGVVVSLSSISDPDVADGRVHVNVRRMQLRRNAIRMCADIVTGRSSGHKP